MTEFPALSAAETEEIYQDAIAIATKLIKIKTVNRGDTEKSDGEAEAADYVIELLKEVGIGYHRIDGDPDNPGKRISVVARWRGEDPTQPGLIAHGHLDVVEPGPGWKKDPFGADNQPTDEYLYGRGAVDMKTQVAMGLAVIRHWARRGRKPPRDMVIALFADEEAGGKYGAQYVVKNHAKLFEGCNEMHPWEVGGYSITLPNGKRVYLFQKQERGMAWIHAATKGTQGHGSRSNDDNPIDKAVLAKARLIQAKQSDSWSPSPYAEEMLSQLSAFAGMEYRSDDPLAVLRELKKHEGTKATAQWLEDGLKNTFQLTQEKSGHGINTVPGDATFTVDARTIGGREGHERLLAELAKVMGSDVAVTYLANRPGWESAPAEHLDQIMTEIIAKFDPKARILRFRMSAGTDSNTLVAEFPLLAVCAGMFMPGPEGPGYDHGAYFHAVNEMVHKSSIREGVRMYDGFVRSCGVTDEALLRRPRIVVAEAAPSGGGTGPRWRSPEFGQPCQPGRPPAWPGFARNPSTNLAAIGGVSWA